MIWSARRDMKLLMTRWVRCTPLVNVTTTCVAAVESLQLRTLDTPGRDNVAAALVAPARQIAENAGAPGAEVLARLRAGDEWFGFDALTGEYGALDAAGIVDPAKVVRCALQNAGGLGGLVLTTDALVVDDDGGGRAG